MGQASERFALLLADIYAAADETLVFVANAAVDSAGQRLLYGADPLSQLHVLAPITPGYVFSPQRGEQIELTEWAHPSTGQRYLDLICRSGALSQVFSLLADSVVERVEERGELGYTALLGALSDWRELLRPARALTQDAARGLFGELSVLKLLAAHNPVYAVECWTGPDRAKHDFSTPNGDLEVKSSAKETTEVTISSLGQLDRINDVPVTLIRLQVVSTPSGKNIEDIVDDLEAMGCLRAEVVHRLAAANFILGADSDEHRFSVEQLPLAWGVGPDFPGLRQSDIPEDRRGAITRISYNLALSEAPGRMDDAHLEQLLERVMTL